MADFHVQEYYTSNKMICVFATDTREESDHKRLVSVVTCTVW